MREHALGFGHNVLPGVDQAEVPNNTPQLRVLEPAKRRQFANSLAKYAGEGILRVDDQEQVWTDFWGGLDLKVPSFTSLPNSEAVTYRSRMPLMAVPFFDDLRFYETLGERARQVFPRSHFGANYKPVRVQDNDHGLFTRFVSAPDAVLPASPNSFYRLLHKDATGQPIGRSQWIAQLRHKSQDSEGTTWGLLNRDTLNDAPPELVLTLRLLEQALGRIPRDNIMTVTNAGIYETADESNRTLRLARAVSVYWQAHKRQIRVTDHAA